MHTAINDYASYRRVTYRSTVEGWVPQGHLSKFRSTAPPDRLERQPGACDCPLRQAGSSDARRASSAWEQAATWLFIAPAHALLLGVIVIPACYVVWLSLTASTFGHTPVFVGIANYLQVLGDSYFWRALGNTIIVVLIVVHVELLAGLGMALLFASGLPCRRFLLLAVLAPYAVSEVSAVVM